MTFSRAQIAAALRHADAQIKIEAAQSKRFKSIRAEGQDTGLAVAHLVPALLAKGPLPVRKVQIALEHLGFSKTPITTGIWIAIGQHTVALSPDFVLSLADACRKGGESA